MKKSWVLSELIEGTHGKLLNQIRSQFSGVGTDTRQDLRDQIFWALKGDNYDAHDFLSAAVKAGATALVVHRDPPAEITSQVTVVRVGDTLRALQDFANFERRRFKGKVLGITGSNGKTTSKEFAQQVLGSVLRVHSNKGSFNNHFGLPLNLLSAPLDSDVILAEMGMNHSGEITRLCEIAEPDAVVCTMVGRGHIEHFGTVEKIARAKEEIYKFAPSKATRIYNLDNEWTRDMYQRSAGEYPGTTRLTFAESEPADVRLHLHSMTLESLTVAGEIAGRAGQVTVPVFGAHNVTNLRVAASLGLAAGLTPDQIWAGLPKCRTSWGRNQFLSTNSGARLLFDGYNANPDSMQALLENVRLLQTKGRKLAVFGEMLELGDEAADAHRELGERAGRAGLDAIYFYGPHAADFQDGARAVGFENNLFISDTYEESVAKKVAGMLNTSDLVLVKGSRGMKMERFVLLCDPIGFETK